MSAHTDIVASGWVAHLPASWRPYALLARLDRPIGAWLLFLPGLWSILLARPPQAECARLVVLFAVGAVLMRAAGCVVNDAWDRDLDRRVARTAARPLASGALRMRQAMAFLAALLALALLILLQLSPLAQALGVASLLLVAIYPLAKRVTWWPQAMLGLTFGWGAPMGYAAATGRIDAAAVALYLAAIAWIIGYDTIYAHQDMVDDALIGVRSTARLFGRWTRQALAVFYGVAIGMLCVCGLLADLDPLFFLALLLPAALLVRQAWLLDTADPALCLRLFRANREVGLTVALAILIGTL